VVAELYGNSAKQCDNAKNLYLSALHLTKNEPAVRPIVQAVIS